MIRKTILGASVLLFTASAHAQVMAVPEAIAEVGVKIGGNFQKIASSPLNSGVGALAGVYIRKEIGKVGARLEITGSMAQYETKYPAAYYTTYTPGLDTTATAKFQVIYINVPLLFEYSPLPRLHLLLGPQFSYIASVTEKNKVYSGIYGNNNILKKTDISIVAGAEYSIKRKWQVGVRLVKGVTDVNNSTYYLIHKPWTSIGGQVSISYRIL